jgi:hypothetical protein
MAAAKDAPTDVLMKSLLVMLAFREELLFIDLSYLKSGVKATFYVVFPWRIVRKK